MSVDFKICEYLFKSFLPIQKQVHVLGVFQIFYQGVSASIACKTRRIELLPVFLR